MDFIPRIPGIIGIAQVDQAEPQGEESNDDDRQQLDFLFHKTMLFTFLL